MAIERYRSAKYWRMQATKFRIKAANAEHQQTPLNAAKSYDELAERAEQIRNVLDAAE